MRQNVFQPDNIVQKNMLQHGKNKTYRVVFEEKEKQKRKREKDSEDPLTTAVAYVDTARLLPQ